MYADFVFVKVDNGFDFRFQSTTAVAGRLEKQLEVNIVASGSPRTAHHCAPCNASHVPTGKFAPESVRSGAMDDSSVLGAGYVEPVYVNPVYILINRTDTYTSVVPP